MRYFLSFIGVMVCVVLCCFVSEENGVVQMMRMGDLFTLSVMLLVIITIIISAGLHRDFIRAFRLALSKRGTVSLKELKRGKEAMDLALKAVAGSGVLNFSISAVEALLKQPRSEVPGCLAVSTLGIIYAAILFLLLIPIQAKLRVKIMEYMEE